MKIITAFAGEPCAGSNVTAAAWTKHLDRAGHIVRPEHTDEDWADADVALVHLEDPGRVVELGRRYRVPLVVFARRLSEVRRVDPTRFALGVFPSGALAGASRWTGMKLVARPPIYVDDYASPGSSDTDRDRITLVNLSLESGASLLYEAARRQPGRKFLGVRGCVGRQLGPPPSLPNLEVVGPVADMREVYARTRILLMPGDQTYGRPAVEAACSGIPTIAHPSLAAMEVLAAGAVWNARERVDDLHSWLRRLDSPEQYQRASEAALHRAIRLDPTRDILALRAKLEVVLAAGWQNSYADRTYHASQP